MVDLVEVALRHPPRAILIEKPLSYWPSEGYRILEACADAGVAVFVNHQMRHRAPMCQAREWLKQDAVGPIRHVRAKTQGRLVEHPTHLFDIVYALLGERYALTKPDHTRSSAPVEDRAATDRKFKPTSTCKR